MFDVDFFAKLIALVWIGYMVKELIWVLFKWEAPDRSYRYKK